MKCRTHAYKGMVYHYDACNFSSNEYEDARRNGETEAMEQWRIRINKNAEARDAFGKLWTDLIIDELLEI